MTHPASPGRSLEIEIKLALPTSDPSALLQQLAGLPVNAIKWPSVSTAMCTLLPLRRLYPS